MHTTVTIDDLELKLFAGSMYWETVTLSGKAELDVDYEIQPAEPGFPACAVVCKAVTQSPIRLWAEGIDMTLAAGTDIRRMLSKSQIDRIEDEVFKERMEEAA